MSQKKKLSIFNTLDPHFNQQIQNDNDREQDDKLKSFEFDQNQIQDLFKIIEPTQNGKSVNQKRLRELMHLMKMECQDADLQNLTVNQQEMTSSQLEELMKDVKFDEQEIYKEVFNHLQVEKNGQIDLTRINDIFRFFGFDKVEKKNLALLYKVFDQDGSNKITIDDMINIFNDSENLLPKSTQITQHDVQINNNQ